MGAYIMVLAGNLSMYRTIQGFYKAPAHLKHKENKDFVVPNQ
jgi:hypothetical protein